MRLPFRQVAGGVSVALAFGLLTGCANISGQDVKTDSLAVKVDNNTQFQKQLMMINSRLPVQKLVIVSGKDSHELEVEIASTDQQRKIGLMNRKSLDVNKGMLFVFDVRGYVSFWMKDTLFPLDMLFIDKGGVIQHIVHNALPCGAAADNNCPKISSEKPVKFVLEVNAGLAGKWGIREGDKATWR